MSFCSRPQALFFSSLSSYKNSPTDAYWSLQCTQLTLTYHQQRWYQKRGCKTLHTHWSFIDTVHIHTYSAELITKARTLKFYLQVTRQNANFFATAYVIQIRHLTTLSPSDQSSHYALGPWSLWPSSLQIAITQPYCTLHLLITHDSKTLRST